jgi:protein-tyrosine phosphatase
MKLADFNSERIEGLARMGNTPFSVPLFSEVNNMLWQGGCPVGEAPQEFAYIINLYPWGVYKTNSTQESHIHTMYDSNTVADTRLIEYLADTVNHCRKRGRTLVHCQAGLNRSAFITVLALIRDGMKAEEAIALLRQKRSPAVLCNQAFEKFLLEYAP